MDTRDSSANARTRKVALMRKGYFRILGSGDSLEQLWGSRAVSNLALRLGARATQLKSARSASAGEVARKLLSHGEEHHQSRAKADVKWGAKRPNWEGNSVTIENGGSVKLHRNIEKKNGMGIKVGLYRR